MLACVAAPAAGAGIHRGDELRPGRKFNLSAGAGNCNLTIFQRLAQHFEHAPVELRQFVEEQHAQMSQGNFAGQRWVTAADQCCRTG